MAHLAIGGLMHDAAALVRACGPPCPTAHALLRYDSPQREKPSMKWFGRKILQKRVSSSRNRINPRGVKRKMRNYNLQPRKRGRTRRVNFAARLKLLK